MNKQTLKWSVVGLSAVALGALALGAISLDERDELEQVPEKGASKSSKPRVLPSLDALGEPGKEQCSMENGERFAFGLTTREVTDLAPDFKAADASELVLEGSARLELEALEVTEERTLVLGRFASYVHGGVRRDELVRAPFLFYISSDCSIESFARHRHTDLQYARMQQALLSDLGWSLDTMEHRRADGFGEYTEVMHSPSKGALVKSFENFEPWWRGADEFETLRDAQTRVSVTSGAPWFTSLSLESNYEGSRFTLERKVLATYSHPREGALTRASREVTDYVWEDLLSRRPTLEDDEALTRVERAALRRARNQSVDEALDEFTALAINPATNIQDTWPGLRTFLVARPEQAEEVARRLRAREIDERVRMPAFLALGRADTPQAKEALVNYIQDESEDSFERTRAILAILDRDDVGVDLARYFSSKASTLGKGTGITERTMARHSILGLGALAGKNPEDEEVRAVAIRTIKVGLTSLEDPRDLRPVFNSIANVGDPSLLSMIEHIPTHPDIRTRESAAAVMRRMPPKQSAEFMASWLEQETDSKVKLELYYNLDMQTFDAQEMTSERVLRQAMKDLRERPGPLTRKAIVRLLSRAKAEDPEDTLGIEALFLELIPEELHSRSGLYSVMAPHVNPLELRKVTLAAQRESVERVKTGHGRGAPLRWPDRNPNPNPFPGEGAKEVGSK